MAVVTQDIIGLCVDEAATESVALRHQQHRYPFFRPVTIALHDSAGSRLNAFTQFISTTELGLLLTRPIEAGQVTVIVPRDRTHVEVQAAIEWCRPQGHEWYLSGGRVSRVSALHGMMLLCSAAFDEAERRFKQRHPFFRPVAVRRRGVRPFEISALSRDISIDGIGLIVRQPMECGQVTMTIPTTSGSADVTADVRWCRSCGGEMYLSGSQFVALQFGEIETWN